MARNKYGVVGENSGGDSVFKWFLGDVDVYDGIRGILGLETSLSAAADSDARKTSHDPDFCRLAVKLRDAAGAPAGRRLVWCARTEAEEVLAGALNGEAWGNGGEVVASAYVPRNLAYS